MNIDTLYQLFLTCNGVTTDSRNCSEGSLFIALKGDNFNGNAFADKALEAGCSYAVIDDSRYAHPDDKRYILTDDGLRTLQQLALIHRRQLGTCVIAITGTNGKTTTKELMAAVLQQAYRILYTQGNLNNAIGVPLTLLRLKPEHELAIIEMGASHPGDIKVLVEIAEPDFGLITNVGKAHLLGFGSFEGVIKTKGELFDYLRRRNHATAFVYDDPHLQAMAHDLTSITYGTKEGLYVSGHTTGDSPFLTFYWKQQEAPTSHRVQTQLIGDYNLPNALAAVTVGCYFRVDACKIGQALEAYQPQNNRSQLKQTLDNTLIIDAYNANPTSMKASIGNFCRMKVTNKMVILGDMGELGQESVAEHQAVIDYVKECGLTDVLLVGEIFAATQHSFRTYPSAVALIEELKREKPHGKTILIKGSNYMKLASLADYL